MWRFKKTSRVVKPETCVGFRPSLHLQRDAEIIPQRYCIESPANISCVNHRVQDVLEDYAKARENCDEGVLSMGWNSLGGLPFVVEKLLL